MGPCLLCDRVTTVVMQNDSVTSTVNPSQLRNRIDSVTSTVNPSQLRNRIDSVTSTVNSSQLRNRIDSVTSTVNPSQLRNRIDSACDIRKTKAKLLCCRWQYIHRSEVKDYETYTKIFYNFLCC